MRRNHLLKKSNVSLIWQFGVGFYLADAAVFCIHQQAGQCPLLPKAVHRVIDNLLDMCLTLFWKKSFPHYKCMELYSNGDIRQSLG
jgi:hypothetical protein